MSRKTTALLIFGSALLIIGSLTALASYQNAESGSSYLSVMDKGLVTKELKSEVAESKGQDVNIIVAYDPVSKGLSAGALDLRTQELKSLAVNRLSPLGFTLDKEEAIPAFGFVVGKAPSQNVDEIAKSPGVRAVAKNSFISVGNLHQGTFADIETVRDFHSIDNLPRAEGITVCVIDSRAPSAPWVKNAVSVRGEKPYSGFWHGVAVAETVHGVAPSADVTVVKTLDEYGTARLSTILDGIQKSVTIEPRADVVNLSLGITPGVYNPMDTACDTISREYGVKVICSAGNTSGKGEVSPATAGSTVSVGALTGNGNLASYSASEFDVVAIGNVSVGGRSVKGTSFASPVVAGMTARWLTIHEDVPFERINAKRSVIYSTEVSQEETGSELPTMEGNTLSQVDAASKPTPEEEAIPYVFMAMLGIVSVVWAVEERM